MYINYDSYRIFYYVAKYENVTQAAAALLSNQPNVTRAIKNLERELGCTLFVRSHRGMQLTPEGQKLYAHVRIAVEQIQAGEEELAMEKSLQSGSVSIGASEVALRCFLLPVLREYQETYPKVRLRVSNYSTPQAVSALKNGLVDVALVTTPTGDLKTLHARNIKEIQEVAVCGDGFQNLTQKEVSLQELSEYPLISLGRQTKTYEFYAEWFQRNGLSFSPNVEASTADQILPMVENNLGIGFVPQEFLGGREEGIHIVPLYEPVPLRAVCYMKRADQTLSIAAKELERMIVNRRENRGPCR